MSVIKTGTTSTTGYIVESDTNGNLVIQTGSTPTTALTLNSDQTATFAQSVNIPNTFGFKNRIINGGMVIDQRNAGASTTPANDAYMTDRFKYGGSQASKFTAQQVSTAPSGFINSLKMTVASAVTIGAGDFFTVYQPIEGLNVADLAWGTASAATVTLSFWVNSSLTGTFGGSLRNSSGARSYPFTYAISSANTWEQKSVTIAGDTTGTWLTTNGIGIYAGFGLGIGSTYSGTAGAWAAANYLSVTGATSVVGTNGATFYITGVQLEKGSTATSFDYRPYGTEEQLCQRYYRITGQGSIAVVRAATQVVHGSSYQNMRAAPTATLLTTSPVFYNFATAANMTGSSSSIADSSLGVGACQINIGGFTGLTAGQAAAGVTTAIVGLNSEL